LPPGANSREVLLVSVEAISWALNLAPVPRDRGGKPNPACKAVLIGLANHAGPDGKEAFPAVRTLIRPGPGKRWVGSCRRELLDRTLIWNQRHLMTVFPAPR
jgi:hypothetical protein